MNTIQVTVAGDLTHDPELHQTGIGAAACEHRLAVPTHGPRLRPHRR